jgi:hypothetical protein
LIIVLEDVQTAEQFKDFQKKYSNILMGDIHNLGIELAKKVKDVQSESFDLSYHPNISSLSMFCHAVKLNEPIIKEEGNIPGTISVCDSDGRASIVCYDNEEEFNKWVKDSKYNVVVKNEKGVFVVKSVK